MEFLFVLLLGATIGCIIGMTFFQEDGKQLRKDQPKEIIKYVYLGGDIETYKNIKFNEILEEDNSQCYFNY